MAQAVGKCPGGVTPGLGSNRPGTMTTSVTMNHDSTDSKLREIAKRLNLLTLAQAIPQCDECETAISEGDEIRLYLQGLRNDQRYAIAELRCEGHASEFGDRFIIGRQDMVVTGRVGQCTDAATDTSWYVLIAPVIRTISHKNWDDGSQIYYNEQPTDCEDPYSGFKYLVSGITRPSRPPVGGNK